MAASLVSRGLRTATHYRARIGLISASLLLITALNTLTLFPVSFTEVVMGALPFGCRSISIKRECCAFHVYITREAPQSDFECFWYVCR